MARYIAFLRAINVGGRTVSMDRLRAIFESMGHGNVETFIASGNAIFESRSKPGPRMLHHIEHHLHDALGYEVRVFLRTPQAVAAVAQYQPFPPAQMKKAQAFNVAFLDRPLTRAQATALNAMTTPIDAFHTAGSEVYWLCTVKQSESKFSNAVLERGLKVQATFRGMNTVQRLAVKYAQE